MSSDSLKAFLKTNWIYSHSTESQGRFILAVSRCRNLMHNFSLEAKVEVERHAERNQM